MNYSSNNKVFAKLGLSSILFFLLSSCLSWERDAVKVSDHIVNSSFTYPEVTAGGVLIAGVTAKNSDIDINKSIEVSHYFKEALSDKREEYSVGSISSPDIDRIGEANYHRILDEYNKNRWIEPELLSLFRDNLEQRYIIFSRIENDVVYNRSSSKKNKVKVKKERKGNKYKVTTDGKPYTLTYKTVRSVTGSYDVFDLAQDIIVWSGTTSNSVSNVDTHDVDKIKTSSNTWSDLSESKEPIIKYTSILLGVLTDTSTSKPADEKVDEQYEYPVMPDNKFAFTSLFEGPSVHMPHIKD